MTEPQCDPPLECRCCAAPLPPAAAVCGYCGSPNPLELGGVHRYTIRRPPSLRHCPRCRKPLKTLDLIDMGDNFFIERCEDCQGFFADHGEVEALLNHTTGDAIRVDHDRLLDLNQNAYLAGEKVTYIKCPVCSEVMNRRDFGVDSGVVVDSCRHHGLWVDGGEFRRLLEWRRAGGQLHHEAVMAERQKRREERQEEDRGEVWNFV